MWFPNAEVTVNPALLLLLGVMVGTLSGFFGVGGGFLITGGLLVFGVPPVFAVGTGLALIMGGITIGDNSIIGANAVVIKDVPEGATVAGIPAKVVISKAARKSDGFAPYGTPLQDLPDPAARAMRQ